MCDTLCIRRPDGVLFAKNSDRPIDEVQLLETVGRRSRRAGRNDSIFSRQVPRDLHATTVRTQYLTIPDAPIRDTVVGSRPTWLWGFEHGVSSTGVAVGNEKVFTVDDPRVAPPALLGMDLVRLAVERSATAEEGVEIIVDLLERHGQGGSGEQHADEPYWSSFLLADCHGGWILETSGTSWVAEPAGDGAAISNRLTLRDTWTRSSSDIAPGTDWGRWRDPAAPTGIADHRLAGTARGIAQGHAAFARSGETPSEAAAAVVATLRDHGNGPWAAPGSPAALGEVAPSPVPSAVHDDWSGVTVCMHVRGYQCTTASMLAWLPTEPKAPIRIWASLGSPCASVVLPGVLIPYRHEPSFPVIPGALCDVGTWEAFAFLARQVELPGEEGAAALAEIRAHLGPVEAAAWAEADELAESPEARRSHRPWEVAATRWSYKMRTAVGELLDGPFRSRAGSDMWR